MALSKTEEQLMELIWKSDKVFMKDLIETFPEPKPASSTIATLLKRMQDKGFVGYILYGNSRQYYPLVKKSDYFTKHMHRLVKNYFDDSALQFASFFTATSDLTTSDLEELKKIIDKEIQNKKK